MSDRPRIVLIVAFTGAIALAVVLLVSNSGVSPEQQWRPGTAVPRALAMGTTVVDRSVPVAVAPQISAWTGSQYLTLGANARGRNVGAVYRPRDGRWRTMAEIPFGSALRGASGVWTGRIWVVTGVLCDAVGRVARDGHVDECDPGTLATAAYEPATDTWRVVDALPFPGASGFGRGHDSAFGSAVGMLGDDAVFQIDGQYYAFRPDSWDWLWLPQPRTAEPVACSIGGTLFTYDASARAVVQFGADDTRWTTAPRAPEGSPRASNSPHVACSDSTFYVYAPPSRTAYAFDPRRREWSEVPSLPASLQPIADASNAVWFRPDAALAVSPAGELSAYRVG